MTTTLWVDRYHADKSSFSFYTKNYREGVYYFELIEYAKKLALSGAVLGLVVEDAVHQCRTRYHPIRLTCY